MILAGLKKIALLICLMFVLIGAMADDNAPIYDRYSLSASAQSDVANDLMTVKMVVEEEDRNSAVLADRINQIMQWALAQVKKLPGIEARTTDYNTYPKYEQKRISGWRSSQTLQLEGGDFETVKAAVAVLQERMIVRNMHFSPRPQTRMQTENGLIGRALEAFRQRAILVQDSMQATGYRVIQISVNTQDFMEPPGYDMQRMEMQMRSFNQGVTLPAVDAGNSRISVSVHGEIQLM